MKIQHFIAIWLSITLFSHSRDLNESPEWFNIHWTITAKSIVRVKSFREIGRSFSIEICSFKLWEMPYLFNLRFSEGDVFFFLSETLMNWKDPLKYFLLFANGIARRLGVKLSIAALIYKKTHQNRCVNSLKYVHQRIFQLYIALSLNRGVKFEFILFWGV